MSEKISYKPTANEDLILMSVDDLNNHLQGLFIIEDIQKSSYKALAVNIAEDTIKIKEISDELDDILVQGVKQDTRSMEEIEKDYISTRERFAALTLSHQEVSNMVHSIVHEINLIRIIAVKQRLSAIDASEQ